MDKKGYHGEDEEGGYVMKKIIVKDLRIDKIHLSDISESDTVFVQICDETGTVISTSQGWTIDWDNKEMNKDFYGRWYGHGPKRWQKKIPRYFDTQKECIKHGWRYGYEMFVCKVNEQ
jgi:hypothetical protein